MRHALLTAFLLVLAACGDSDEGALRQVTIESPEALGLSLREMPASALRSMGLPYGLAVVKAGILAERAGLRIGDVVYGVNQKRIRNVEDFTRIVAERPANLGLLVRRGTTDFYVPMDLGAAAPRSPDGVLRAPSKDTLLRT
jgi:membrane-associated protease RseP (regulator of RpoE activity)